MAIRKTDKGYYVEVFLGVSPITNKKVRKTKTFKMMKDAKDWERDIINKHEKGTLNLSGNITLSNFLDYWFDVYAATNVKETTQQTYQWLMNILKEHIGTMKIKDIKALHVDRLYADMKLEVRVSKKGIETPRFVSGTILKTHKLFRQAMEKACAWDMIARNPVSDATAPQDNVREIDTWTVPECLDFLDKMKDHVLYMPIFIAFHTGLRRGEICALKWEDVNLQDGYLDVIHGSVRINKKYVLDTPKTPSSKDRVALTSDLAIRLKELKQEQRIHKMANGITTDFEYVCCWNDGRPLSPNYVSQYFRIKVAQYGMKKITFHGLRHTHATILFLSGATSHEVSKRLRHSDVGTTDKVYIHITEEMKKNTATIFDRAIEDKKIRTVLGQIE